MTNVQQQISNTGLLEKEKCYESLVLRSVNQIGVRWDMYDVELSYLAKCKSSSNGINYYIAINIK